jgi:tetratricopeptide (TPR) repeat protein
MTVMTGSMVDLRPQPLGVFPFPAGLLLLPHTGEGPLEALMRGELPTDLPPEWRFFALAAQGKYEDALAAVAGNDAAARHNRFVLGGDLPTEDDGEVFRTLRAAVQYASGRSERPPSADGLDAELRAFVLMLQATRAIEEENYREAIPILEAAVIAARPVSPEFAAQLMGQLAVLEHGTPGKAIQHYRTALAISNGPARSELSLQLGIALQDVAQYAGAQYAVAQNNKAALLEAVKAYQDALRFGITLESHPESFALLQNNLALAYLAMPASEAGDRLRMGIAVQSLREALKVYKKETHPEQWASAQLNLANALQYIPTSHPEENLIQAVEIYDEILTLRQKALDPVGYARLLANQANALAHLGIFGPAMDKIGEAYKLFQWHNEPEMAASAMALVENISQQRGDRSIRSDHNGSLSNGSV